MNQAIAPEASRALRRIEDLPGPRGLPFVGNAFQFKPAQLHQKLEAWSAEYGPYYRIRIGPRRIMVNGDHAAVAGLKA